MNPDTLVLLITKNRLDLTKKCLSALLTSQLGSAAVIAIDNGSTDGTITYLEKFCPGTIHHLIENAGSIPQWQKSYAICQAADFLNRYPSARYFAWIDNDMVVAQDWLVTGKAILEQVPGVVVASLHTDELQEKKHKCEKVVHLQNQEKTEVRLKHSANGAIWVVRRTFFGEFGPPPVKGMGQWVMEDWHYSKIISMRGKWFAVANKSTHIGYQNSERIRATPRKR